jgi:hypothetical protein
MINEIMGMLSDCLREYLSRERYNRRKIEIKIGVFSSKKEKDD